MNGNRAIHLLLAGLLFGLLSACASLPPRTEQAPAPAFASPAETSLGALTEPAARAHPGESGFLVLESGRQALLQRALLIEAAERSIDAQYYIWNSDASGRYLACRLYAAAERGVRVRLLLDDMNVAGRDSVIAALDRHPHIDIRIFNPSPNRGGIGKWLAFASEFQRLNRRMHNKALVADAAFGIVGGRNIGDEYFDLHPQANFRDRDVLAAGPVAREISAKFDVFWNSPLAYPIALLAPAAAADVDPVALFERNCHPASEAIRALQDSTRSLPEVSARLAETLAGLTWAEAELVFDPPATGDEAGSDAPQRSALALAGLVEQAREEILVESAYLILGDAQLEMVAALRGRGVRVAALTNSLASNDLTANHSGYARRRKAMLDAGLELYELRPDAADCVVWIEGRDDCGPAIVGLHSKSAVFDRSTLYIGSFNLNLRSIYLNSETVLLIHSPVLAAQVAGAIEAALAPANSWRVSRDADGRVRWSAGPGQEWTHEPATGFWHRFKSGLFRLVPMEKYL